MSGGDELNVDAGANTSEEEVWNDVDIDVAMESTIGTSVEVEWGCESSRLLSGVEGREVAFCV